jgi:hypothetical protein
MHAVQQEVPPPLRGTAGDHNRRPMRTLTADRLAIPRGELLLTAEITHAAILTASPELVKGPGGGANGLSSWVSPACW